MADSVPIHGNYRGVPGGIARYYTKRPSFRDPRLSHIPRDIFKNARVLDIGCNEGFVTCEIAHHLGAREVIGVDIDDGLVRAAWKRRRMAWSQHPWCPPPSQPPPSGSEDSLVTKKRKRKIVPQGTLGRGVQEYSFPAAFEHMFGPLPIPPAEAPAYRVQFPHNVVFRTADWLKDGIIDDKEGYDVVLALSVSKWIHLNNGDEGLLAFFQRIYSALRPGGILLLEPQEWETYHKARRMDPNLKKTSDSLRLRPADFGSQLMRIGFCHVEHLGHSGKGGFRRGLDLYRK